MSEFEIVSDELANQLCQRIEELEHEKSAVLAENDALTAENIELRKELAEQAKQLASMRAA
ncbi:hypothetical protein [Vreelandella aquamarina]|uniref:hypothetical protein n=1 Tax=Vreelandella aquamarina TaxID=77097 RepID=UPI001D191686|nr:hypothetical protein [Halomonas meridiana]MCC4288471.1 hypothetical protein [Halomonas meridiana]